MKKFILAIMFGLLSVTAFAEATFDQIQTLIEQRQYQAAEQGLEVIIQNHPKSAKAFYAMAQAQAGLGNQEKAKKALDLATGLNPTLDFAPASSVASLKQAITPQVAKIEAIEESHFGRNIVLLGMFILFAVAMYFLYSVYARKQEQEAAEAEAKRRQVEDDERAAREVIRKREHMEMLARQDAERKAELAAEEDLKAHKNYGKPGFDPSNPDKLKTKAQLKAEADAIAAMDLREAQYQAKRAEQRANEAESLARAQAAVARSQPAPTIVNNNSGGNDMLTGVLIGNMLGGSHHDHTTIIERETVLETPAPSRSSSWDDTPAPSRSSSWDDDSSSSSSKSGSWDDSSSKSSSSWSSSSDSSSSSSWDSGSSSSDSGSSSSWD